ncbi:bacterial Ig-like domain-containing protein [Enterococcus faecalis]|uniref:bacterial Ig-like domain-containing protein n=1 Tax=Enterococcus faecalis TaxID=1351 RepID=UPI003CC638E6
MKIMKKIFSLFLFFLFLCVNQELIAFAEIANVKTEEQIDNNTSNEFELSSRISNPKLLGRQADFQVISDYHIIGGDKFETYYPFLGGADEFGRKIEFKDMKVFEYNPARPGRPGRYQFAYTDSNNKTLFKEVTVTYVKEDGRRAELKNDEIFEGERWELGRVIKNIRDKDGNPMSVDQIKEFYIDYVPQGSINTSIPGEHKVQIAVQNPHTMPRLYSNYAIVTVKKDKTTLTTNNSTLYVGQKWKPEDNFYSATDEEGHYVPWKDPRVIKNNANIDTSKPGVYNIKYTFKGKFKNVDSEFTVTVKEDKTSLDVNNVIHYIYQGEQWNPKRGLKKATDADGNILSIGEVKHWWGGNNPIDPNKVGDSKPYFYRVYRKNGTNICRSVSVQVKENKSSIKTKNSTLYVGQKWEPKDNFINATDEEGNAVLWEDPRIIKNNANLDTSKPGVYNIKYTFKGKFKNVDSEFTVTVKEEPFIIKKVPQLDFDDYILGSTNKSADNNKETSIIELETPSIEGKDWQLQVELSPFVDKKNEKNILKGVSLFIPKGKLESDLETEEPTQYECKLEANGKASILMYGTKIKGKGRWKNKLETKGITLSVPPENKVGNYESTLHWTLLDVPG